MSIYISTNPGELEISPLYADNEIVLQEVCFSVWYDEWSEFEKSQLFRDIVSYVENCRREIPERHIDSREQECTVEIATLPENSKCRGCSGSLSEIVRRWLQRMKQT